MPVKLKAKDQRGRVQEAIKAELVDFEKHPKKFPGGPKQAMAIGYSIAGDKKKVARKNTKKRL